MASDRPIEVSASENRQRDVLVAELEAVAARDELALRRFFDLTSGKVFGLLLRILGDHATAEDVLQDVYLTVWLKASTYDGRKASPMTWLVTIARNRAIDRRRAMANRVQHVDIEQVDVPQDQGSAEAALDEADRSSRLQPCLARLDQASRAAITSAFFGGLTYEQLALRDGVPLGTMKSRIRRGLLKLRLCIGDESPDARS